MGNMLRIIIKIFGLQLACFFLLLICCSVAGQEKGVFWFALIAVTILVLGVVSKLIQRAR